jgi:hypothetical protein
MKAMKQFTSHATLAGITIISISILSACNNTNTGNPIPAASDASSSPTTSDSTSTNIFADLKACDVLDKALEGQDFEKGAVSTIGGDNGCDANKTPYGGVALNLQPDQGIDKINADPSKIHDGTLNNRRIAQIKNGIRAKGDCAIMIEVTKTSRASMVATLTTGTTDEACTFIYSIAEKIEPQLPKGN